ncbi:MAG: hypothetical protein K2N74_02690, partial [Clostridiales bacterium]|nr:hypothetical protein [Clostridiales bacterium]
RKEHSKDAHYRRLNALYQWQTGAQVLVSDIEAAVQLVPEQLPVFRLAAGKETNMRALVEGLIKAGYTREYTVESKGMFAVRGDILDIFPVNTEHPVRVDFFGDEVESIKPYDEITAERYPQVETLDIVSATDAVYTQEDAETFKRVFADELKKAPNATAYSRLSQIATEITAGEVTDFVLPILKSSRDFFSVLGEDTVLIFDECKLIKDKLDGLYKEHFERFSMLKEGGEAMSFSAFQYAPYERVTDCKRFRALALSAFVSNAYFFNPMQSFHIPSGPARKYLNSLPDLFTDVRAWLKTGYRVLLWAGSPERAQKLRDEFSESYLPLSPLPATLESFRGVAVTEG